MGIFSDKRLTGGESGRGSADVPANVGEKRESADKPGSVVGNHSSGIRVTADLKQPTRERRGPRLLFPYLALLRVGFTVPLPLPVARCALTAPFHPYLCTTWWAIGGLFSVALAVGSRRPGVTWHPAQWSPDFPPHACVQRLPGRLPRAWYRNHDQPGVCAPRSTARAAHLPASIRSRITRDYCVAAPSLVLPGRISVAQIGCLATRLLATASLTRRTSASAPVGRAHCEAGR